MREKFNQLKDENKILIMVALFSIAIGIWGNFKQLWLQANNLEVTTISNIISLASLLCAGTMVIIAKRVKLNNIKEFIAISLLIKIVTSSCLLLCNNTGNIAWVKVLIIIDIIVEKVIITSIYPFMITIRKDDKLYSKRKLVEYLFKDVGILIGGILIGRSLGGILVDYNFFLGIAVIFLIISFIVCLNIKQAKVIEEEQTDMLAYIKKNKIVRNYLIYIFTAGIAISTGLGLKMLMFTNLLNFSPQMATGYFLIIGLAADVVGIIALRYLTPKNDYLTITIKFMIRMIGYSIAFLTKSSMIALIAITWSILISTAYENKSDAPYINMVGNTYQLQFSYLRYIVQIIAEAIGIYFAGITYCFGITAMLGASSLLMIPQIIIAYYLVYQKKQKTA